MRTIINFVSQGVRGLEVVGHGNSVSIHGVRDFYPEHIFDCGQAFRWKSSKDGYTGVVGDKVVRVEFSEEDQRLLLDPCTLEEYHSFWKHYFDFNRDYGQVKKFLSSDPIMKDAIDYGWGMRVLNQDPWEILISFILSANNNITRIKGIIEKLSVNLGQRILWEGNEYYTFPTPESLAFAEDALLKECGCGYRGKYIKKTAEMVVRGLISPYELKELYYEEAHKELTSCSGVGDKVADCILLYSMEKAEAFPVDVWVKRVMEYFYIGHPIPAKQIKEVAKERFGPYAGLAQQYLFYYAREKKIGK